MAIIANPRNVKLGVYVNGSMTPKLQSRDRSKIDAYAERAMNDKRNTSVWVAPVGSFVTATEPK